MSKIIYVLPSFLRAPHVLYIENKQILFNQFFNQYVDVIKFQEVKIQEIEHMTYVV
jgi:hypothetical protein